MKRKGRQQTRRKLNHKKRENDKKKVEINSKMPSIHALLRPLIDEPCPHSVTHQLCKYAKNKCNNFSRLFSRTQGNSLISYPVVSSMCHFLTFLLGKLPIILYRMNRSALCCALNSKLHGDD